MPITKDYTITYNGSTLSTNTDTGLSSINLYYGSTLLGEGAHTIKCSDNYMVNNLKIGTKTLNCANLRMKSDVKVTTSLRYKPLYLILNGVDQSSITGGWESYGEQYGIIGDSNYPARAPSVSSGTGYIQVSLPAAGQGKYRSKKSISCAEYSKLYVEYSAATTSTENTGTTLVELGSPVYGLYGKAKWNESVTFSAAKQTVSYNIASLSSIRPMFLMLTHHGNPYLRLYNVYLSYS